MTKLHQWKSALASQPLFGCILLIITIEFLLFIFFRKVNLDEGWYLWASKLVYDGQILYRDFAYTQTPLLPYVYGLWQLVAGEGVMAGRILTAIFGLLTAIFGALVVRQSLLESEPLRNGAKIQEQSSNNLGPLCFFLFFGTSVYAIAYLSYTATYGLACFLLTAGIYFAGGKDRPLEDGLMAGLLSMAAATRLSTLPFLPIFAVYRIARSRNRWRSLIVMTATVSVVTVLALLLSFVDGSQMRYDIFGFHTDRIPSMARQFGRMLLTAQNTARAYGVPIALIAIGVISEIITLIRYRALIHAIRANGFELALISASLGSFLLHLWPRTTDAYYNTLLFPIWIILASLILARWMHQMKPDAGAFLNRRLVLVSTVAILNLLFQMDAVRRNDLFRLPPVNQMQTVRKAADFLSKIDRADNQLLTLNTHLALESGMNVPSGYEMSIFSYRPDWTTEQATQYKVVNNQMLVDHLVAGVDAVAVTDFDLERFFGERQLIFDTLNTNYRLSAVVPGFDPFYNNLYIYLPPQFTTISPQNQLVVEFENDISLLGYDLEERIYEPGDQVYVALYWRSSQPSQRTFTTLVHLFDNAGNVVFGWDNPPCRTTCPTDTWLAGEILRDEYTLEIPLNVESGTYRIRTGMYNSDTGSDIAARSVNELAEDNIIQDGRLIILDEIAVGN